VSERGSRESRRLAAQQARLAQQRRRRRLRLAAWGGAALVVAGAGLGLGLGLSGSGSGATPPGSYQALSSLGPLAAAPSPGATGPENVPVPAAPALAGTSAAAGFTAAGGQAVDGVGCQTSEQTLFHIHAHLTIFVNGQQRQVPAGIGIPAGTASQTPSGAFVDSGRCFYWLHTHAADGIIHIESPVKRTYTLGDLFDLWGQPLGPDQAGPARGKVTVIVNGRVFQGNPRAVPLGSHENLQLEVGAPLVAPETINWSPTGL